MFNNCNSGIFQIVIPQCKINFSITFLICILKDYKHQKLLWEHKSDHSLIYIFVVVTILHFQIISVNKISSYKNPVIYTGASIFYKNIPFKNLKKSIVGVQGKPTKSTLVETWYFFKS